jgi:hypothetical protein
MQRKIQKKMQKKILRKLVQKNQQRKPRRNPQRKKSDYENIDYFCSTQINSFYFIKSVPSLSSNN